MTLLINITVSEYDWVAHAADLRGLSVGEYVKRAINASLMKEGVDAVLLKERESASSVAAVGSGRGKRHGPTTRDKSSSSSHNLGPQDDQP